MAKPKLSPSRERIRGRLRPWINYFHHNSYLFFLPILILMIGTLGYRFIENVNFLDAFYMTAITISTVGFREIVDLTTGGKLFTVLLIFSGLTTVAIVAARLGEDIISAAAVNKIQRMEKRIAKMKDHYILCGYGGIGRVILRHFSRSGAPCVVIDNSPSVCAMLRDQGHSVTEGDATTDETLERAAIKQARGLVTVLSSDADNVFVVLSARQLNPGMVILARAFAEESIPKLYHAGASKVFNPYENAGGRIAHAMLRPVAEEFVETFATERGIQISIEEIVVRTGSPIAGKTLRETQIRSRANAIVVAIKKAATGEMR
ncbi:MAG: potassium channel protein, partial [Candidatus Sumerlaeota bacterium]|nr:potassium channel protein [Candidatus Sumerlaeota bacterium]